MAFWYNVNKYYSLNDPHNDPLINQTHNINGDISLTEQPKIKIVVKPASGSVPKKKEAPPTTQPAKCKKGLIRKIVEIVSNDIRHLPDKIWGKREKTIVLESDESWRDWEGEL
jgi:hypothetical protein